MKFAPEVLPLYFDKDGDRSRMRSERTVDGSSLRLSNWYDDVDGDAPAMYKPRVGRQRDRRNRGLRIDAEGSHAILGR